MGLAQRHSDCECAKYAPAFEVWSIRLDGKNYLCRSCNWYVDPAKWKGGLIHFTNRTRIAKPNECPCCGRKMSRHRYAKKRLVDSVAHQEKYPELHDPRALKRLKKKVKILPTLTRSVR